MPFLERDTQIEEAQGEKYVLINGQIYYAGVEDGLGPSHVDLVRSAVQKQGKSFRDIEQDDLRKPVISAAGKIENVKGKFGFGVLTVTCRIRNPERARAIVDSLATTILGENRVYTSN